LPLPKSQKAKRLSWQLRQAFGKKHQQTEEKTDLLFGNKSNSATFQGVNRCTVSQKAKKRKKQLQMYKPLEAFKSDNRFCLAALLP
jgi:hypothetical protein